jgi:aminoglycoside 3-N-acetyltransferase
LSVSSTSYQDLMSHLDLLGVKKGDKLVVHSRLISFGEIQGGALTVLSALREFIGPKGTVIVPTYTLQRGTVFSPGTSPSQGMGPLSELVRLSAGRIRSLSPMHNHCGLGPDANILQRSNRKMSLGCGSDFDIMHRGEFKLLLLGAKLSQGATFLHHLEAVAEVPYRQWVELERECINDERVEKLNCMYFVRMEENINENFDGVEPRLANRDILRIVPTHYGSSRLASLTDLQNELLPVLNESPYALTKAK